MKKFALLAAAMAMAACNTGSSTDQIQARLEANKALIVQLNDAQNAWDSEAMGALMAPDIKRHSQATPDVQVNSRDEYLDLIETWRAITPDAHQVINMIVAEGDMVAVHVTFSGTQTGAMGPIPPTNNHFDSNTLAMFKITDGLIREVWVEWDNLAIMSQLGVLPPAGGQSGS